MTSTTIDLTVVITLGEGSTTLSGLLEALGRQSLSADRFECIVVDDGNSVEFALDGLHNKFEFKLLEYKSGGPGAARNLALQHSRGRLTLFLDEHAKLADNLLDEHLHAHANCGPKSIVLGSFPFSEKALASPFIQVLQASDLFLPFNSLRENETLAWEYFSANNLSLETQALREIGGFDSELFDTGVVAATELGYRFQAEGYNLRHFSNCYAENELAPDIHSYFEYVNKLGFYRTRMWAKHQDPSILSCEDEHQIECLLALAPKQYKAMKDKIPALTEAILEFDALGTGMPIDQASFETFLSAISLVSQGPWHAGVYQAVAGTDLRRPNTAHNVVIMGSGRSGTSMVAGTLANAGWFPGSNPYKGHASNPKGFYETAEINGLNEYLLASHWPEAKPQGIMQRWLIARDGQAKFQASSYLNVPIQRACAVQPFVIKDPRMCYTLDAWRPHLADARFVCIFRDPAVTASSMLTEVESAEYLSDLSVDADQALEIWSCMYARILEQHQHDGQWLFLHYEQLFTEEGLDRLEQFVGAPINRDFPEQRLSRSRPDHSIPAKVAGQYKELCQLANHTPSDWPSEQKETSIVMPTGQPKLSVVLCSYNRIETLKRCLDTFEAQDAVLGSFEMVIVDDGCTDGTGAFLDQREFKVPVRIVHRESGGSSLAKARNAGLAVASGELVLFINDDTMADPVLVRRHIEAHAAEPDQLRCVLGTFEQPPEVLDGALMRVLEHSILMFCYRQVEHGGLYDWQHFYTCNVSVPLAAVKQVGNFDESFIHYGAEDTDLGFRLHQAGYRVRFDSRARATHEHTFTYDDLQRRNVQTAQAWVHLINKHPQILLSKNWTWVAPLTAAGIRQHQIELFPLLPAFEQAARSLSEINIGELERAGSEYLAMAQEATKLLDETLLAINKSWWLEGFLRGLETRGFSSFDDLVSASIAA
ncbi:MAG: glycosyltransferase involved in cell wall biosynthesis [Planctomycetota bacterium]|jgi:glycosyltransferase involved in cell wall biosynthesis